ncbi:MAG: hypothetical protein H0X38_05635 [Planctomycetes bacterium]|nr:hypothetical protein [Planctomycetota bacterium]
MSSISLPLAEARLRQSVERYLAENGARVAPAVIEACMAEVREFHRAATAFRYEIPFANEIPAANLVQIEGSFARHAMALEVHMVDAYLQGAVRRLILRPKQI